MGEIINLQAALNLSPCAKKIARRGSELGSGARVFLSLSGRARARAEDIYLFKKR